MNLFVMWLRRRAAKRMAAKLPGLLSSSYGASAYYTVPQIKVALGKIGLSEKYFDIAFAEFLDFDTYFALTKKDLTSYQSAREMLRYYTADSVECSVQPAPVNEYVKQMSGLQ